jgi:HEAT repeat protein
MAEVARSTMLLGKQLLDPTQSNAALLKLLAKGEKSVPVLVEFLRTSRISTVPEGRLLAVEGLGILKGPEARDALIEVATRQLAAIADPAVRLAEESVVSAASRALADFDEPRVREVLLGLLEAKPLVGVAEAFEKLKDERAIPGLIAWLGDDFVAEAAARALVAIGRPAIPLLQNSLNKKLLRYGSETGISARRRARVLEVLESVAEPDELDSLEALLFDPVEAVRWNTVRILVRCGARTKRKRAIQFALRFLDSADSRIRYECEELLRSNYQVGPDLIEEEIRTRRNKGESDRPRTARESALEILLRIRRQGGPGTPSGESR